MSIFEVPTGMPKAIFENKYSRMVEDEGRKQTWVERTNEVVEGNFSLIEPFDYVLDHNRSTDDDNAVVTQYFQDKARTTELAAKGVIPFSGRHLQHGDSNQKYKSGEVFSNCSTSMFSFVKFWLLMKGSGVGRSYDSDLCRVNWDNLPNIRVVLEGPDHNENTPGHDDWEPWIETVQEARHKYDSESDDVRWFTVGDSAEGWCKVIEILETAAFQGRHKDKLFIFDFSEVRPFGSPIKGQQNRPSSGPVPFMKAILQILTLKGAGMKPWKQAMYVDHYLAACVVIGGIRRSARIAVKNWKDNDIFEFIDIKRGGWLYTANNSVGVDKEFWEKAKTPAPSHARRVFEAMVSAAYFDKTGEPGFLNLDNMYWSSEGVDNITPQNLLNPEVVNELGLHDKTLEMFDNLLRVAKKKKYPYIVNPCGEIILAVWGGYCTIGDICLANADSEEEAMEAGRLLAQCLMRVNTMKFLYQAEVNRTNRIGVGLTGLHEFAYKMYGANFYDLIENQDHPFWTFLKTMRMVIYAEVRRFAQLLGVAVPHTFLTMKPSGTISKVMNCTEAAHLAAYDYYMRWVQYNHGAPEAIELIARGYPHKDISAQYENTLVIGFPTAMPIAELMGDSLITMRDVTPEEQYLWLNRLEDAWLGNGNNQISYTLKYNPDKVDYMTFMQIILDNQKNVRACSVMPQIDTSAYIYTPEERISKEEYLFHVAHIDKAAKEGYDKERLECEGGACPIEPDLWVDTQDLQEAA